MNNELIPVAREVIRPPENNEVKSYYWVCPSFVFLSKMRDIIDHAIMYYLRGKEAFNCSEKSIFEFFMYLVWLIDDGSSSFHLEVWEYTNENDYNDGIDEIDHYFLVHFWTPQGFINGIRRYLDDGSHTLEILNLEPYERKYMIESWDNRNE